MKVLSEDFYKKTFQELPEGEIFRYGANFFIKLIQSEKVIMHDKEGYPINAVNIGNGAPAYFQEGIIVTYFYGEVMITR